MTDKSEQHENIETEMSRPCFSDAITLPGQIETEPELVEETENLEDLNRSGGFLNFTAGYKIQTGLKL